MTQLAWMLHEYIAEITLAVMLLLLLFMGILLQKINAVKKRLAKVTGQVEEYLNVILEDGQETVAEPATETEVAPLKDSHRREQEAQSQLISAVLEEIFP